ncbi:MAG TPA: hypothetical protein VKA60_06745 [Blastocatellia bacterium]|nr:hypothetical protein [Blastocatellia bacterium]
MNERITAGSKIDIPGIDWKDNKQTLLLVLAQGCHFCSESAPFYKQLVEKNSAAGNTKFVAIFPREVSEGHKYLDDLGVPIADVRQVSFGSIHVGGTPTLILVDSMGVVKGVWLGKVAPESEAEVLNKVLCNECGS